MAKNKTLIYIVLLAVFILLFLFLVIRIYQPVAHSNPVDLIPVARFGQHVVTTEEFNYFLKQVKEQRLLPDQVASQVSNVSEGQIWGMVVAGKPVSDWAKQTALELAQNYKVQLEKAQTLQLKLLPTEENWVQSDLQTAAQIRTSEGLSKSTFYRKWYGLSSEDSFRQMSVNKILIQKFKEYYSEQLKPSDTDLRAYFDRNTSQFTYTSGVSIQRIRLKSVDSKGNTLPYAQLNAKEDTLRHVLKLVKEGKTFEELAKTYSEFQDDQTDGSTYFVNLKDPVSSKSYISWFQKYHAKEGDLLGPFQLGDSLFIMKYVRDKKEHVAYEQAKNIVRVSYQEEAYRQALANWTKENPIVINNKIFNSFELSKM